jgi:HlyD family secretion protein
VSQALQVVGEGTDLVPWSTEIEQHADQGLKRMTRNGLIAIAVLVFGCGGLMALLPMAGAVIAPGEVSVETQVKQISHPFGGVAGEILVRDGDRVKEGDVLIRLDDTVAGANAEYTGLSLDQLLAKEARLRAVRDGAASVSFPAELHARAAEDPFVASVMRDEARGFALGRQSRGDMLNQLQARISQTQAEITSLQSRAAAYDRQASLIGQELAQTRELYENSLSTLDRVNALERAQVGVQAERSSALAGITEAQARIGELRTQMAGLGSENRSQAALELAQVQALISESRQRAVTAGDTNDRTAIRAPQSGYVNRLAVHTIGGVVPPGQVLMEIVPDSDQLVVEANVAITDIDNVAIGQPAFMRFTALSMRTTPELQGKVVQVDPNRTVDEATGMAYYTARVEISEEEFAKLGDAQLTVGMPVEVFIQTGQRTILNYILRPLSDQLNRALRE